MKLFTFFFLCCLAHPLLAQQDPLYANYLNSPIVFNPAYTGPQRNWQNVLGYRSQWRGFDGNPTTIHFASHASLVQNRVGLGLIVVQDNIGESKNTEVNLSYAYKIENDNQSFHFGLSTGITRYSIDGSMIKVQDNTDPNFISTNTTKFNTGVGAMLKSERYIIGLSIPRLLPAKIKSGSQSMEIYQPHYYLFGAYVVSLNERAQLKPAALLKATEGAPVSLDVNFNVIIDDAYTVGALTRNLNTYGLLLQAKLKNYRLGYVFEMPTNKSVGQRFSSHEITLSIAIPVLDFHTSSFQNF
jgi:type IX secretion system PorP/SprF family membrane protein